jgi:hypothetical protein
MRHRLVEQASRASVTALVRAHLPRPLKCLRLTELVGYKIATAFQNKCSCTPGSCQGGCWFLLQLTLVLNSNLNIHSLALS